MSFALALKLLPFPAPAEMCITWLNIFICSARLLAVSTSADKGLIISSHGNDYSYRQVGCHLSLSLITTFPFHKKKDLSLWHWGEHRALSSHCSTCLAKKGQGFYCSEYPLVRPVYCQSFKPASIPSPLWRPKRQIHPWRNTTALSRV